MSQRKMAKETLVMKNCIEIIKGNNMKAIHLTDKLYWYCNKLPPKNIADSFFFNVDEVSFFIFYLHLYRLLSTVAIIMTLVLSILLKSTVSAQN